MLIILAQTHDLVVLLSKVYAHLIGFNMGVGTRLLFTSSVFQRLKVGASGRETTLET